MEDEIAQRKKNPHQKINPDEDMTNDFRHFWSYYIKFFSL